MRSLSNHVPIIIPRLKLKISYDALKSVLTIFPMTGKLHSRVLCWVIRLACLALIEFDSRIRSKVEFVFNEEFDEFEGPWKGSLREPEFGVAWKDDVDSYALHTLVQVKSSQSQNKMLEVMNSYLRGAPTVSRFILINITEAPRYKSPKKIDLNEFKTIDKTEFKCDSNQGPLWYKGIQWVGRITISWNVWERDPVTGEPKQICKASIIPADCGSRAPFTKILPYFMVPTTIAPGAKAVTIKPADINLFWHERLRIAVAAEAVRRIKALESKLKRKMRNMQSKRIMNNNTMPKGRSMVGQPNVRSAPLPKDLSGTLRAKVTGKRHFQPGLRTAFEGTSRRLHSQAWGFPLMRNVLRALK